MTLRDLISSLDAEQARGIDALELFAPYKGGTNYDGLDTLDYYAIDPEIDTMADFQELIAAAHSRGMAIIAFMNLGYGHEDFPAFLKACDDVRNEMIVLKPTISLWNAAAKTSMDRSLAPHFMNDWMGNGAGVSVPRSISGSSGLGKMGNQNCLNLTLAIRLQAETRAS